MAELLTTKQMQDLLKVDRVTVYRMLSSGRLRGVKIGNQWRFPQSEIDRLLGEDPTEQEDEPCEDDLTDFPSECVYKVQGIFAGILGIGAITVTLQGELLTDVTFSNPFCKMMLACPSGKKACQEAWKKMVKQSAVEPPFMTCHAGLNYLRSPIEFNDQLTAWLIAGQFQVNGTNQETEDIKIRSLADKHNLSYSELKSAHQKIPHLKQAQMIQVQEWTPKVAATVQSILCERSDFMDRLQRIAELSAIRPKVFQNTNEDD
ncbi:MAG: PocR ligand-binding domain-containing protein [Anaerolineaceae bacterium]|nr:PocR ligand-binding domain-containing protein [Anaerolineaceae bacterium]